MLKQQVTYVAPNLGSAPLQMPNQLPICLKGGSIVDPANSHGSVVRDLWIRDGRIVVPPDAKEVSEYRTIDCSGRVLMAGGIDMHSHIVGPKVNAARKLQPELFAEDLAGRSSNSDWRKGGNRTVPTVIDTGLKYLGMGYTTVMDAAITPLAARQIHFELEQFPVVDAGFYLLCGNNHRLLECAATGDTENAAEFLSWILNRCGGYAPKIVNPGGVELWKQRRDGNARDLDQIIDGWNTTPRRIIQTITRAANQLSLPHPVHIHTNNLGMPGNWQTTLETMRAVDGLRAHLTHIQFHSYGGGGSDAGSIRSETSQLIDWVNNHPELSVDVGQVLFGRTTSMTGDGPLGHWLSELSGAKWYSSDTEIESGCGISPIEYRDRDLLNSIQWAIGLEWYLGVSNPWQVVMSTDHPNGASFLAYPQIIRLLMDREFRRECLGRLPSRVLKRTRLAEMDREYTLEEIAIITRAGPARLLGMSEKGHLEPGAVADVTVYSPDDDQEMMFQLPWLVLKSGLPVLEGGELRSIPRGVTHAVTRELDGDSARSFEEFFDENYSLRHQHLGRTKNAEQFSRKLEIVDGSGP